MEACLAICGTSYAAGGISISISAGYDGDPVWASSGSPLFSSDSSNEITTNAYLPRVVLFTMPIKRSISKPSYDGTMAFYAPQTASRRHIPQMSHVINGLENSTSTCTYGLTLNHGVQVEKVQTAKHIGTITMPIH